MDNKVSKILSDYETRISSIFINITKYDVMQRIVYDSIRRILYANDLFLSMIGYELYEVAGVNMTKFIYEDDVMHSSYTLNKNMNTPEGLDVLEDYYNRYVRKDGTIIFVNWIRGYNDKVNHIGSGQCIEVSEEEFNKNIPNML
jgi:PAS domain S-box-containing protein